MIRKQHPGTAVEITVIKTKGDIMQDVSLVRIGGKGVFVKEIEDALLKGEVDLAVHSMKDMPAQMPEGLEITATPMREDPRDVLISRNKRKMEEMTRNARIGTGSLRRAIQVRELLPDVEIVPIRGNVDTRIRKVEAAELDAVIVAAAGIRRMGWMQRATQFLPTEVVLPAAGQGILALEQRVDDDEMRKVVSFLNHADTWIEATAERAFLKRLGGGCQLPIAAFAKKTGNTVTARGLLASLDGKVIFREEIRGEAGEAESIGTKVAEAILARGGQSVLEAFYSQCH
jgi:hydroxymethylbilane synthase